MSEFFKNAGAAIKKNAQHVIFGYPFTSGAIALTGFILGAWVL